MEQHVETIKQIVIEAFTNAINFAAERITEQLSGPAQEDGERQAEQVGDFNADFEGHGEQAYNQPDPGQSDNSDTEDPGQFQEREREEVETGQEKWHFRIRQNGRQECGRLHQVIVQV